MKVFFIQYECCPKQGSENQISFGGAFFSGWIVTESLSAAKSICLSEIASNGWESIKMEEAFEIEDSNYDPDEESLAYYHQAKIDGECYAIDTWPNESQDEEKWH